MLNVEKHFVQTIFQNFAGHFSSKQYCRLLFLSKKEPRQKELDNEGTCYLWPSLCFEYYWCHEKKYNNTSNKCLSHYFKKNTVDFRQRKNLRVRPKNLLTSKDIKKDNYDVITLIMWLMLKLLLSPKMCCTTFQVIWVK